MVAGYSVPHMMKRLLSIVQVMIPQNHTTQHTFVKNVLHTYIKIGSRDLREAGDGEVGRNLTQRERLQKNVV